ncbi:unnamed protein product [Ixodes hexagonus]
MHTPSSALRGPLTGQLLPGTTTSADAAAKRGGRRPRRSLFVEPTRGHGGHGGFATTAFSKISEVGNPSLLRCVPRQTAAVAVSRPRDSPFALCRLAVDIYDESPSPLNVRRRRRITQRGVRSTCRLVPVNDSRDDVRHYHVSRSRGDDDKENRSPSASTTIPAVALPAMYAHNGAAASPPPPQDLAADLQLSGPEKTVPMKRRKSDDGERSKKPKLESQRGCESDSGLPPPPPLPAHHHHHHHRKTATAVAATTPGVKVPEDASSNGNSVHGVCTLKEGSLKLKISLHRPPATPDGDCLSPSTKQLPHDADNSGLANDSPQSGAMHASNAAPSLRAQLEQPSKDSGVPTTVYGGGGGDHLWPTSGYKHLDEQLRLEPEDSARSVQVSDLFVGSYGDVANGPLQSPTRTGASRPRKNLSPGHYVPYSVPQNRKRLIQDTSKLKKRAPNVDQTPLQTPTDRTRHQQTFRHTQVGQNGGVVHHSSILDHPSVHSRMFADSPQGTDVLRGSPSATRLAAPSAPAVGSKWKHQQPSKGKANSTVSSQEYQPLDLSKPVPKNANLAAALARPIQEATVRTRENSYIPPIGVFYMKPRSRQRLDGVIQKLWATRNSPDKPR